MKTFAADLHIHTALSPCAANEMTPPAIVERAIEARLDIIAICDHNCALNIAAVQEAAKENRCACLRGLKSQQPRIFIFLGFFLMRMRQYAAGEKITPTLAKGEQGDITAKFGEQFIIDAAGHVKGKEERMLASSLWYSLRRQ